ncbi:MAG: hypothetical protein QGH60_19475 [Phycisphaerae bacterium]|jgi:hypothetical protein|nr:hypothetical protein [Phycisphaerae bacterium]
MKSLLILTVLAATFLFGYHLGRSKGSPDVVGWLQRTSSKAYVIGKDVVATVSEKSKSMMDSENSSQ